MSELIFVDGASGEGGGQILRSALALSLVTGRPFRMERVRAGRARPGLLRQHLTAVQAAATVGSAHVSGAELGSGTLTFEPRTVAGGDHRFLVGTAGSTTLVLQAILPALVTAPGTSRITLGGGTHNPGAPSFDFLALTFLPLLRCMGVKADVTLGSHGFYPAGGGSFTITIDPVARLRSLSLLTRGPATVRVRGVVASLPPKIAQREVSVVRRRLGLDRAQGRIEDLPASDGPGNVVMIEIESEQVTELVTAYGSKGVTAEQVATSACDEAAAYLATDVPVGPHLADQLLLPMALSGAGQFRSLAPTPHTTTNAAVIGQFLDVSIVFATEADGTCRVTVGTPEGCA